MKKFMLTLIVALSCLCGVTVLAQEGATHTKEAGLLNWRDIARDKSLTYQEIVRRCDSLFKDYVKEKQEAYKETIAGKSRDASKGSKNGQEEEYGEGSQYTKYIRWRMMNGPRMDAKTGKPFAQAAKEAPRALAKNMYWRQCSEGENQWSDWHFIGPQNFDVPLLGRVNCISVNPGNNQEIYVSDSWGGLWKTTDEGTTWASLSDNYFNISGLGVTKFVVDYSTSPHRIFAAVGYITEWINLDLAPSTHGLYYSYDDGQSFSMASFNSPVNWEEDEYVSDMKIHPNNPNKIFITSKFKLMRANFNPISPSPGANIDVIIDYDAFGGYLMNELRQRFNGFTSITFLPSTTGRPNPLTVSTRGQQDMHRSSGTLLRTNDCITASNYLDFEDITFNIVTSDLNVNTTNAISNGGFATEANWIGWFNSTLAPNLDWVFGAGNATTSHTGATPYTSTCLEQKIPGYLYPYIGSSGVPLNVTGTITVPNNAIVKMYIVDYKGDPWSTVSACNAVVTPVLTYRSDQDPNVVYGTPYNFSVSSTITNQYYNRIYFEVEYTTNYTGGTVVLDNISMQAPNLNHIVTGSTPAAPGTLYSMVTMKNNTIYVQRSTDYGDTWSPMGTIPPGGPAPPTWFNNDAQTQGWTTPDCEAMVVSGIDPDKIYYGWWELKEFNDGDNGPSAIAHNYAYWPTSNVPTHADIRSLYIRNNGSDEEIYVGHDGGLSTYHGSTANWVCNTCGTGSPANATNTKFQCALTQGIGTDVYGGDIAVAAWDNGTMRTNRDDYTQWAHFAGGDGWRVKYARRAALEHTTIRTGNYSGWQAIAVDIPVALGITAPSVASISNPWFARMKTTDVGEYYGDFDMFRLTINGGTASWDNISSGATGWISTGKPIAAFAGDQYDGDVVAAFACSDLWSASSGIFQFTTNGGASWTSKANPFGGNAAIDMAIDPRVNNGNRRLWAGMGWYSGTPGTKRVYQSTDNGNNWTDYSDGLPDGPVNALAFDHQANILYAGTDIGVYFRKVNDGGHTWECYSKNLPNTIVTDLELDRCQRKLYAATFGRGAWQTDLHPNYSWDDLNDPMNTLVVNSHTIWSNDMQIDRNVFVQPGAKLEIQNCTIHMARGRNFIIENTGTMVVDHATITNGCNSMWGDIVVKADETLAQVNNRTTPLSNSTSNQGLLILDHANLENALNAILVGNAQFTGFDYLLWAPGGDGGVVMAENSTFLNCDRAVCFNVYNFKQYSFFEDCNFLADAFLKDDQYVNTTLGTPRRYGTESFATSWLSDGVRLENCTFRVDISPDFNPDPDLRGVGWGQAGASTTIENCTFENLTRGTFFSGMYGATNTNTVKNCTYTNIWRGATFLGVNHVNFTNNNMTVGPGLTADGWGHTQEEDPNYGMQLQPYGLYYSQGQLFSIQDNIIDKEAATPFSYGIIMNNVYDPGMPALSVYSLYRNTLYTDVGITANQDNRGVQLKCNKLYDDMYGILVSSMLTNTGSMPSNGRLSDQGNCNSGNGPADNEFNYNLYPPCNNNAEHIASIDNNPDNDFVYYNHTWSPYQAVCYTAGPPVYSLINPPFACSLPCNSGNCCPDPPPVSSGGGEEEKRATPMDLTMLNEIAGISNSITDLEKNIEKGNADQLMKMVDNPNVKGTELKNTLNEAGAYLSDDILKKVIERRPALSYADLKEVIIANSGLRAGVWQMLETAYPALAEDEQVLNAQKSPSLRTALEGAITELQLKANYEKMNLVYYYTRQEKWDAIGALFENDKAYLHAFPYYLKAGNIQKAQDMISNMPDKNEQRVCMLQTERASTGKSLQEPLSASEKVVLKEVAANYESRAGEAARNWLRLSEGDRFMEPMPVLPSGKSGKAEQHGAGKNIANMPTVKVYPNPAQNEVSIALENGKWANGAMICVYDILGRKVATVLPDADTHIVSLNTRLWSMGHYIVVVTHPGKKTESHKLVIER